MLIIVIFCSKLGLKEREETPTGMRSKLALAAVRFKAQSERERERERGECVRKMKPVCNVRVCVGMCVRARDKVLIHFLNEVECVCEQRDRGHKRAREGGSEVEIGWE